MTGPRLTLADVYEPLVRGLDGIRVSSAPVALAIRCGIQEGDSPCGCPIGEVVRTPRGHAWRPAVAADPRHAIPPGHEPMLLPATTSEQRQGWCDVIDATCRGGHGWQLATSDVERRAKRSKGRPYYITRVPHAGGMEHDPSLWTDLELLDAVAVLYRQVGGMEPPPGNGMEGARSDKRATILTHTLAGAGPFASQQGAVMDRLRALVGDSRHI